MFGKTYYRIMMLASFAMSLFYLCDKQLDIGTYTLGLTLFFQSEAKINK